jgi:hypothetical protein
MHRKIQQYCKKTVEDNDFVTYNLVTQILADVEHHSEDILKYLEINIISPLLHCNLFDKIIRFLCTLHSF